VVLQHPDNLAYRFQLSFNAFKIGDENIGDELGRLNDNCLFHISFAEQQHPLVIDLQSQQANADSGLPAALTPPCLAPVTAW